MDRSPQHRHDDLDAGSVRLQRQGRVLRGRTGYLNGNVAPGETYQFFWDLDAPMTPGTYDYGFMLRHGTQEFGPYFFVQVTVQLPSISGRVP